MLLGANLFALLLVDAVVVDLMLFGVHVLGSVIDDITVKVAITPLEIDETITEIYVGIKGE